MTQALVQVRADIDAAFAEEIELTKEAMRTGISSEPIVSFTFATLAQMFEVFTANRWDMIQKLQGSGPLSVRGLARALGRDVRRVHDDVSVLLDWGIIERNDDNKVFAPYDHIHLSADIRAAA